MCPTPTMSQGEPSSEIMLYDLTMTGHVSTNICECRINLDNDSQELHSHQNIIDIISCSLTKYQLIFSIFVYAFDF